MSEKVGLKGRLARMFLNFLDEHGNYRTQLEEAAARAAAASASSLLAKDREGRKKKRRKGRFGLGGEEFDDDELELLEDEQPKSNPNQLPEDPYDQVQFYIRTFRQRTYEQFREQVELTKLQVQNWMHDELHHPFRVPACSVSLLLLCGMILRYRKRRSKTHRIRRVHGIMGKKFVPSTYLHPNFVRGKIMGEYSIEGIAEIEKLKAKAQKAEEAALASMRPHQRKKYERLKKMEMVGEQIVTIWLLIGMVASVCCAVISVGRLYGHFMEYGEVIGSVANETEQLDGYIYSIDGPADDDGYPLSIKNIGEENYAACLTEAEARGVEDPTTECDVKAFFETAAAAEQLQNQQESLHLSPVRENVLHLLNYTRLPPALKTYIVTLSIQTVAYIFSLFSFSLFLFFHYISHKIHIAAISNDPMKHFVATANDDTIKADGTVVAKRGETEAQRKRRERMLQQEKMKAQMAQLAMEAKQKVDERRRRLEGEEAVKKEEEEAEVKKKEEQDETVKMHSRQFMMLKAGVPDGAILNTFLAEGIEDEEGKEILEKLKEIKAKRAEDARKQEEEEEARLKKEAEEEKDKERIAAERLRVMRQGSYGSRTKKPPQSVPGLLGQPAFAGKGTVGPAPSSAKADLNLTFSKVDSRKTTNSNDGTSSSTNSSIATVSTAITTTSSKKEDPTVAKGKMLGDIEKVGLGSLRKTTAPAQVGVKVITSEGIADGSSPLGKKKVWGKETKSWMSTTPLKSNVTNGVKNNFIKSRDDEEKKEIDSPLTVKKQDLDESSTTPFLACASSQSADFVSIDTSNPSNLLGTLSGWGRRLTAADIQAQIKAVESKDDDDNESIEHEAQDLNLGPNAFYSRQFDQAIRNSNASWDRRPSSRDIMAKIKEAEELEAKHAEIEDDLKRAEMIRFRSANRLGRIGENEKIEPTSSVEVRRKAKVGDDDSEVSELSMTTYEDNVLDLSRGRSIPNALFLRQDSANAKVTFSPVLTSSPLPGFHHSKDYNEKMQEAIRMSQNGELSLPTMPVINDESSSTIKSDNTSRISTKTESKEESEEERLRKERAEKRAKKMEEIAAKRNAGEDEGASVSGLFKLRRRRKKKAENDATSVTTPFNATNEAPSDEIPVVEKEETEEEKQKRLRAEKRAKKMEEIAAKRNTGKDDDISIAGISKHHRLRRKKSALEANARDKEKNDYCTNIYSTILHSEQVKWRQSIFTFVLKAEETKDSNTAMTRSIEEQNVQARRIKANQKNLEMRAKKFAVKANRFLKLRQEGASHDDDSSVVSSKSMMNRRRRTRKSTSQVMTATVEMSIQEKGVDETLADIISPTITSAPEKHDEASQYGQEVETNVISTDQNILCQVGGSDAKVQSFENEAIVQNQKPLAEAVEKQSQKTDDIKTKALNEENISPGTQPSVSGGAKKKMKNRRRKASLAKKAARS